MTRPAGDGLHLGRPARDDMVDVLAEVTAFLTQMNAGILVCTADQLAALTNEVAWVSSVLSVLEPVK